MLNKKRRLQIKLKMSINCSCYTTDTYSGDIQMLFNDTAMQSQIEEAEKMLYSVWMTTADLRDSIIEKRISLLQLRIKLKIYSVLENQLSCLDEWVSTERDHINSLTWAIQDLQASAIRIPITGRARVILTLLRQLYPLLLM